MRGFCFTICAVVITLVLFAGGPAAAQYTTASLAGTAVDSSGAAIPAARITVQNVDTEFRQSTSADGTGAFLFPRLPVGNYRVTVEHSGFVTYVREGLLLTVNQNATVDVAMQLGALSEKVTVQADVDLVNLRSASTGQLIDQKRILNLPLNGRSPQALLYLAPGTTDFGRNASAYGGANWYVTPSVNGAGWGQVNYQMDGTGNNDTYSNLNQPFPNPDAVQEFNLVSGNFTAEYGNAAGGIVNIITKSGTNVFHGSVFEFLRNGSLNARNFFAIRSDTLKRNQFGGTFGGPIIKDKLFFFSTYQGTRDRSDPAGRVSFVPTAAERTGDFSGLATRINDPTTGQQFPGNRIPASRLSSVTQYLLKYIPLPNAPGRELNYNGTKVAVGNNQGMLKIDYNRTRNQLSARYFADDYRRPSEISSANLLAADSGGERAREQSGSLNYTYARSPTMLLNTTLGFTHWRGGSDSSAPFSFPDAGVKIASSRSSVLQADPNELILTAPGMSINTNHLGDFNRDDYTLRENVTLVRGAHELRLGGEIIRVLNHNRNTFQMDGIFSFTGQITGEGIADLMIGRVASFVQGGGQFKNHRGARYALYFQDNWRLSRRLNLNLGLRWDPYLPPYDRDGRVNCFQTGAKSTRYPNSPAGLIFGGETPDADCPVRGQDNNWGNFAPRVGFAYRLTEDGKTSLRGGTGYYYSPPPTTMTNGIAGSAPFSPSFTLNDVSFEDPYGSARVTNPFPAQYASTPPGPEATFVLPVSFTFLQKDFHVPLVTTWNLAIERQLGGSWLFRTAYVGNKGTFLWLPFRGGRQLNPATYIPGQSTLANIQARRPYAQFGSITAFESANNSNYHGLQLVVEKRFSHGFTLLSNYTWAKQLDDVAWVNPFNRHSDYGPGRDDVRHVFRFSNVWEIPKLPVHPLAGRLINGWMVNSIVTWQSGLPFTVTSGRDNAFTGTGGQRADFLGGNASLGSDRPHAQMIRRFFDTTRFTANAVGTFGNSGKFNMRGPRYFVADANVVKNFLVTERVSAQFRAEFFNFFNNPNFRLPDSNAASGTFGRISGALDPRIVQFAIKVIF